MLSLCRTYKVRTDVTILLGAPSSDFFATELVKACDVFFGRLESKGHVVTRKRRS